MTLRKRAVRPFRVALVCDVEAAIEARAKILPSDHGRQLDELCIIEMLAKGRHLFVGCGRRRHAERDCVVEHLLFEGREGVTRFMSGEIAKLFF